ncbi:fanconi anemia group D2 protein [Caerostris extrusa]|uniref:Fanconi anemia group D2 protein n=1 Tax=Caerostris extrusa TaxID=172846 RepID=A0AAV4QEZ2_CAEEX|nr:fanconi anemia group D2 protein [Caerostris extrusa]
MLSILAYQGGREGTMLLDDMMIIIRKQLTNKNLKYRKMGVIGALMSAKTADEKETEDSLNGSVFSSALDLDECCQHSIKLLELVKESTSDSCEAFALFCDELSHIMLEKKLNQAILDWIGENILSDFEETYVIDINFDEYSGKIMGQSFIWMKTIKSKKSKSKRSKTSEDTEQTDLLSHDTSSKSKSSDSELDEEFEAKIESDIKTLKSVQPFFRELDLEVFILLQLGLTFKKRLDIFINEKVTSLELHPTELKFLLEDLSAKLQYSIGSSVTYFKGLHKQTGFSNLESHSPVKIIMFCIQLIPALCKIVDEFIKFFKNITNESDGIEDSLVLYANETQCVIKCFNLVLKVMKQIVS